MLPVPLPIAGMTATRMLAEDAWQVTACGRRRRLRAWRWGERRRLVDAASHAGRLDREAFLVGLTELLYDPPPPAPLRPIFATAALLLLGVDRRGSLRDGERALARRFGWTPGVLEHEPAARLDALLEAGPAPAPALPPGWRSIRITEDDAP